MAPGSRDTSAADREVPDVRLPPVSLDGALSVEAALETRRSRRRFRASPLPLETVGQLLWAAQGVTAADGGRTAPSAGALYPLELLLTAGRVEGLAPGIYRYLPGRHSIRLHRTGDARRELADAALGQPAVRTGAALLAIAAVPARTAGRYGSRAERYFVMEAGHAAQNVCLQATALGLGSVVVGAFEDSGIAEVLGLPEGMVPLALLPTGRIR